MNGMSGMGGDYPYGDEVYAPRRQQQPIAAFPSDVQPYAGQINAAMLNEGFSDADRDPLYQEMLRQITQNMMQSGKQRGGDNQSGGLSSLIGMGGSDPYAGINAGQGWNVGGMSGVGLF